MKKQLIKSLSIFMFSSLLLSCSAQSTNEAKNETTEAKNETTEAKTLDAESEKKRTLEELQRKIDALENEKKEIESNPRLAPVYREIMKEDVYPLRKDELKTNDELRNWRCSISEIRSEIKDLYDEMERIIENKKEKTPFVPAHKGELNTYAIQITDEYYSLMDRIKRDYVCEYKMEEMKIRLEWLKKEIEQLEEMYKTLPDKPLWEPSKWEPEPKDGKDGILIKLSHLENDLYRIELLKEEGWREASILIKKEIKKWEEALINFKE